MKPKHSEWWEVRDPNGVHGCMQFNAEGTRDGRWMLGDNWVIPSTCKPIRRIELSDGAAA